MRPVPKPAGPLFTLRVTQERFDQLGGELGDHLRYRDPATVDARAAAWFCIYASEWWRRHHAGGPYRWRGIQDALGVADVGQHHLRSWTRMGLEALDRELIDRVDSTRYLDTLAAEAGLPLLLVKASGSQLHNWLIRLFAALGDVEVVDAEQVTRRAEALARQYGDLSRRLMQPPVYQCAGTLIAELWPLIREVEANDVQAPLSWLDRHHPGWRTRMPIELDDEVAIAFLNGLVADASTLRRQERARLAIVTTLARHAQTGDWHVLRSLRAPRRLPIDDRSIEAHAAATSIRVRLVGHNRDTVVAVLRRYRDEFSVEHTGAGVRDAPEHLSLELTSTLRTTHDVDGGMPLGPLPWVFHSAGGTWQLAGTGSLRSRHEELCVAVPRDATTTSGDVTRVGSLWPDRDLYSVRGLCRIETRAGSVEIEAGVTDPHDEPMFSWRGAHHPVLLSTGGPVFAGWPTLERRCGGIVTRVDYDARTRSGWTRTHDTFGSTRARHVDRTGRLELAQRIAVVPAGLKVEVEAGARAGVVRLRGPGLVGVDTPGDRRYASTTAIDRGGAVVEVAMTGNQPPPTSLALTLDFRGFRPLEVEVPFPVAWRGFVTRDGRRCDPDERVHIGEVGGVAARVVEPGTRDHYLHLELHDAPFERILPLRRSTPGVNELDLREAQDTLRSMLSQSLDRDATVRVSLFTPGARSRAPRSIRVQRYDWKPAPDKRSGEVTLPAPVHPRYEALAEVRRFANIQEREPLEPVPDAHPPRWTFPIDRDPGPYLVTVRDGVWIRGRPLLWTIRGHLADAGGLLDAIHESKENRRHQRIDHALTTMADDLDHPDWVVLDGFLSASRELPPGTFDVLVRLTAHDVLPLVALRLTWLPADERMQILESLGDLPLCWPMISVRCWWAAFERLFALEEDEEPGSGVSQIARAVDDLASTHDAEAMLLAWCVTTERELPTVRNPDVLLASDAKQRKRLWSEVNDALVAVRQRHPESATWPHPGVPAHPRAEVLNARCPVDLEPVIQAPARAAAWAADPMSTVDLPAARAFRTAYHFDPLYFDEVWTRCLALALAPPAPEMP